MSKANSIRFFATGTLSILINPFLFVQALLLNIGQLYVRLRETNELTRSGGSISSQCYGLPLCGEWLVLNGGVTRQTSHSWDIPNQRYAYDFVKAADSLEGRSLWKRRSLSDFSAFGQPIFAPADGIVVRIKDGQRDYRFPGSGHSTQPHLHFQVQDRLSFYAATSKIVLWSRLCRNGTVIDDCVDLTCNDCVVDASGQIK